MSTVDLASLPAPAPAAEHDVFGWFKRLSPQRRTLILSLGGLTILSIVRLIANADDLTSSGT
ncbi:MAG: hypothetical protein ABMA25_11225, partial [Ilumatobacteraceae bacterium]